MVTVLEDDGIDITNNVTDVEPVSGNDGDFLRFFVSSTAERITVHVPGLIDTNRVATLTVNAKENVISDDGSDTFQCPAEQQEEIQQSTMNEAISRQVKIGLYLIEDAILDLLYITRLDDADVWLNNVDIHHALGLPTHSNWYSEFTQIMLDVLHETGRIQRDGYQQNPFWRIDDTEFRKRKNAR